jgi:tRNA A37 N6-isopentenylltransferase MiaA
LKKKNSTKIPVLVIFAPTASGKTALMYDLFSPKGSHFFLTGEVISADSMQVYKGIEIASAAPTEKEKRLGNSRARVFYLDSAVRACAWYYGLKEM